MRRKVRSVAALTVLAGALASCGGASSQTGGAAPEDVLKNNPPLKRALVTPAQLNRYPASSVQRAFFEYWSTLQFQSWLEAIDFYTPALRRSIGTARLVEGLKVGAEFFRSTRPLVLFVTQRRRELVVRYVVQDPTFGVVSRSMSFRRFRGRWEIVFDPALDQLLGTSAQSEANSDPSRAGRSAARAGAAASRLQSLYLGLLDPAGAATEGRDTNRRG